MKHIYTSLFAVALAVLCAAPVVAQTIWDGPIITFTKPSNSDWTLAENQDQITDNVHITRANNQGIFNIVTEPSYTDFSSPSDTEWAIGTTDDIATLTFQNWEDTSGSNPPSLVDQDMVVHLITDDIYIDIKFTSWIGGGGSGGGGGGGFSYERSTESTVGTEEIAAAAVQIFPNPATDMITVTGPSENQAFTLLDITGAQVKAGTLGQRGQIVIDELQSGVYFLKLNDGATYRVIKE